ncbi:hypothetical protein [Streptomyces sp. NPDC127084]|uniref:hypothetical protein n=1 Tax=Streptomyces sp. NPDC127084 TaxID=3347133 RepID=UPI003650E661
MNGREHDQDDRTGNDIVNHGPQHHEHQGPDDHSAPAAPDFDELGLRRMLHQAVEDLAPADGTLERLRKAVPARRARKRQALVGAAASVVLLGVAIPAFVQVAESGALDPARPVNAGHGEQAQGGTGDEAGNDAGDFVPGGDSPGQGPARSGEPSPTTSPDALGSAGASESPVAQVVPEESIPPTTPTCGSSQLVVDGAEVGAPDAEGKVYGAFRIANTSATSCAVTEAGSVVFHTAGAADAAKISVVDHVAGDPATGLPDPAPEPTALLLGPAASYEVKFAFVPSETCPTTTASPDPTPPADGGSSGAATEADGAVTEPQLGAADGGRAEGSITVSHIPAAGDLTAEVTIPDACAGTIYRTGVLST